MPVYIQIFLADGRSDGSTRGSTRGPRGPKDSLLPLQRKVVVIKILCSEESYRI